MSFTWKLLAYNSCFIPRNDTKILWSKSLSINRGTNSGEMLNFINPIDLENKSHSWPLLWFKHNFRQNHCLTKQNVHFGFTCVTRKYRRFRSGRTYSSSPQDYRDQALAITDSHLGFRSIKTRAKPRWAGGQNQDGRSLQQALDYDYFRGKWDYM